MSYLVEANDLEGVTGFVVDHVEVEFVPGILQCLELGEDIVLLCSCHRNIDNDVLIFGNIQLYQFPKSELLRFKWKFSDVDQLLDLFEMQAFQIWIV